MSKTERPGNSTRGVESAYLDSFGGEGGGVGYSRPRRADHKKTEDTRIDERIP